MPVTNQSIDLKAIRLALLDRLPQLVEALGASIASSSKRHLRLGRRSGSLVIDLIGPKRGLWFDHSRQVGGDLLELIRAVQDCTFKEALYWATNWLGEDSLAKSSRPRCQANERSTRSESGNELQRLARALEIWTEARAIEGTPGDDYLTRARGIEPLEDWPSCLRFHPRCPRGSRLDAEQLPALVALMSDVETGEPRAIHRTFLRADGSERLRDPRAKMALGSTRNAAIMLSAFDDVTLALGVGEGLETCLSIWAIGWRPVWAVCGAGNLRAFPALGGIEHLTLFADNDSSHDQNIGLEAANACGERWVRSGVPVDVVCPRTNADWNEALKQIA